MKSYVSQQYSLLLILIFLLLPLSNYYAQSFVVEKISGDVKVQRGTNEEWENVTVNQTLNGEDVLLTGIDASIQLNRDGDRFILKDNSALGLNYVKSISINDLLLALAREDIRNLHNINGNDGTKNTAVYGEKIVDADLTQPSQSDFGLKKLNGAIQLAENGFKETSILAARETYRKYPSTKSKIELRMVFANILSGLKIFDEAIAELNDMKKYASQSELEIIDGKISEIYMKIGK